MTRNAHTNNCSPGRRSSAITPGCLVLVVAPEPSALDLLLTAVRRRMPHSAFEFPMRLATRRNGLRDVEIAVSRNVFALIERDGGMIATWATDGHRFGLPDDIRRLITEGKIVVVAAPAEVAPELQGLFPDLRVLRFTGQLDAARAPLTPRACLRRIVGPRIATRLESRVSMPRTDAISHAGDLPSAVRSLSEGLLRIEEERSLRKRRAGASARRAPDHVRRSRAPETSAAL